MPLLAPLACAQPALQAPLLAEQAERMVQPHDPALSPDVNVIFVTDMTNSRIVVLHAITLKHIGVFSKVALSQTAGKAQ